MNIMGKDQLYLIMRNPDKRLNKNGQKAPPDAEH